MQNMKKIPVKCQGLYYLFSGGIQKSNLSSVLIFEKLEPLISYSREDT